MCLNFSLELLMCQPHFLVVFLSYTHQPSGSQDPLARKTSPRWNITHVGHPVHACIVWQHSLNSKQTDKRNGEGLTRILQKDAGGMNLGSYLE